jgi:transposase
MADDPPAPSSPGAPHPWAPMTDAEWAALALYVTHRRGRPPRDPRGTWDGIFWIACSDLPWAALPAAFGYYRTVHSALIHAGRTGVLDRLLIAVSDHVFAEDALVSLRWRVQRAVRRASRQLGAATLYLARDLALTDAIYCAPGDLPAFDPPDAPPRAVPPRAPGLSRLPYIPRRVLRGLEPPRGIARAPRPAPVESPPALRRASQRGGRGREKPQGERRR